LYLKGSSIHARLTTSLCPGTGSGIGALGVIVAVAAVAGCGEFGGGCGTAETSVIVEASGTVVVSMAESEAFSMKIFRTIIQKHSSILI